MSKKTCDDAIARIYPYLDGEMTVVRKYIIRRHLRQCPPCGDAFSFEQRLQLVVREKTKSEVPPEFLERLRRCLQDEAADPGS